MIGRALRLRGERGSAVVEFTLVSVVLVAVFLAVVQFGFVIHVRNTLVACAAEGARHAANADRGLAEGEARTTALIGSALSPSLAGEVRSQTVSVNGVQMVEITV
ncbi:MAG TPA: TadE family protein, partial [Actinomycetes bacterium]|nr:TadE family protein [Actinomycetes bacterium]